MIINVIDNLESTLPRNIICADGKATTNQSIAPEPNNGIFYFDLVSNKYTTPEMYAENYIENGEFPDYGTHIEGGTKTMPTVTSTRYRSQSFIKSIR